MNDHIDGTAIFLRKHAEWPMHLVIVKLSRDVRYQAERVWAGFSTQIKCHQPNIQRLAINNLRFYSRLRSNGS